MEWTRESDSRAGLTPTDAVAAVLEEGAVLADRGDLDGAARRYARAAAGAANDPAGRARALAQLASLEESRARVEDGHAHNREAQELFLAIGDGAGLVQTLRVEGFLWLRSGEHRLASTAFSRALGLALQLDARLVMSTLDQIVPASRRLVETDQVAALLPLGAGLKEAVRAVEGGRLPGLEEFAELAATLAGVFAPLGLMAEETALPAERRRELAAGATHQAWHLDALTRRRWQLADLVKVTLQTGLDFQERVD